jgi:hypothetical protein
VRSATQISFIVENSTASTILTFSDLGPIAAV